MKKILACLAIAFLAMSFKTVEPTIYHYPFFDISYSKQIPANAVASSETFSNGVFVKYANDYFVGIDSVAVKYLQYKFKDKTKFSTTYTNFYSRIDATHWNKYGADKKLIGKIEEMRNDTALVFPYSPQCTVIYYKVE